MGGGIWKSTDGGASWVNTTRTTISPTAAFSDLVMDPTDHLTLYAAVGEPAGRDQNGVYKTTDGGATWDPSGNFPVGPDNGRISIGLAASAPGTLYAGIAGSGQGASAFGRLYKLMKTTNGGVTWSRLTNPPVTICATTGSLRTNVFGTAGDYHNVLAVDPANANVVYVGGICLIRSTTGGTAGSWLAMAEGTQNGPHRDHHALVFDASDPPRLLDGNDGGLWRLVADGAWQNLNTNLQITQFVGFDLHPSNPNIAHGGTQDTGIMKYAGDVRWLRQVRGDGGTFAVNAFSAFSPPYRVYAISRAGESDNNWFRRSSNSGDPNPDGTRSWLTRISPEWCAAPPKDCQPKSFYPPFVLQSSSSPVRDRLLVGTDRIYESRDAGNTWRQTGMAGWTANERVDSVAVAPSDENTIYASAGGHIFASADGGANWRQADVPALSDPSFVALLVDPSTSSVVYAVRDRFDGGHVFRTDDAGVSWTDISGNLPNLPAYSIAVDTRATPNVLYVGTDSGVWVSRDSGVSWAVFGVDLPNAQVVQLKLNERLNILAAATHGRGVFEIQP